MMLKSLPGMQFISYVDAQTMEGQDDLDSSGWLCGHIKQREHAHAGAW